MLSTVDFSLIAPRAPCYRPRAGSPAHRSFLAYPPFSLIHSTCFQGPSRKRLSFWLCSQQVFLLLLLTHVVLSFSACLPLRCHDTGLRPGFAAHRPFPFGLSFSSLFLSAYRPLEVPPFDPASASQPRKVVSRRPPFVFFSANPLWEEFLCYISSVTTIKW